MQEPYTFYNKIKMNKESIQNSNPIDLQKDFKLQFIKAAHLFYSQKDSKKIEKLLKLYGLKGKKEAI